MPETAPKPPQLLIVSVAMILATLMYIVVAFVLAQNNGWAWTWQVLPAAKILVYAFAGLACLLAAAALMLPSLGNIPRIALAEAIAILGLVLAFLNQSPLWVLPFAGLSLILQVFLGPFLAKGNS